MVKVKKGLSSTPLEKVHLSPWAELKTKQRLDIQLSDSLGSLEALYSDSLGFDYLGFAKGDVRPHNELL